MDIVSVSQVNRYIKALLDENSVLKNIYVRGEISNFKGSYGSGHLYFTLKDETGAIKCVMFSSYASSLKFMPENGMAVVCRGSVSVYEKSGEYQLYAEDMEPAGEGAYLAAFNQLRDKLEKEGLFDERLKKKLPLYPKRIGVATSNQGAALQDIINITKRRYPLAEVVIAPTVVQGEQAPQSIVSSIKMLDAAGVDVMIVGRGGGSIEDLWAFNSEEVARAVVACKTPVVSAVGHETDYTICDFVADMRAPTPSAAAELVCPDAKKLHEELLGFKVSMKAEITNKLEVRSKKLSELKSSKVLSNYGEYIRLNVERLNDLRGKMRGAAENGLKLKTAYFTSAIEKLEALSPLAVLERGYTLAEKDGTLVKSAAGVAVGDDLMLRFHDGRAICNVKEVKTDGRNEL